jgi:hypothetical protein
VTKKMGIGWQLRVRMAERGVYSTTELVPLLAGRGVHLSREQVYRLVTAAPQRLSMDVLAARNGSVLESALAARCATAARLWRRRGVPGAPGHPNATHKANKIK